VKEGQSKEQPKPPIGAMHHLLALAVGVGLGTGDGVVGEMPIRAVEEFSKGDEGDGAVGGEGGGLGSATVKMAGSNERMEKNILWCMIEFAENRFLCSIIKIILSVCIRNDFKNGWGKNRR
jgi:hypothetical protein